MLDGDDSGISGPAVKNDSTTRKVSQPVRSQSSGKSVKKQPDAAERGLPSSRVNLSMHEAELGRVFQVLARAGGPSIAVSPSVQGTVNINVESMPWDQVFTSLIRSNQLSYSWEGDILRIMTAQDLEQDFQMDILRKKRLTGADSGTMDQQIVRRAVPIRYVDAADVKKRLDAFFTKGMPTTAPKSVEVDEQSNSLILFASTSVLRKTEKIIARLDVPVRRIRLVARFAKVSPDAAKSLGIHWAKAHQQPDATVVFGLIRAEGGKADFNTRLKALAAVSKVRIIAEPVFTTTDSRLVCAEPATRPSVKTASDHSPLLRMEMIPHVVNKDSIAITLHVLESPADATLVGKALEATLIAGKGETVVVSGLNGASWAVKDTAHASGKNDGHVADGRGEYLVFITPELVDDWEMQGKRRAEESLKKSARMAGSGEVKAGSRGMESTGDGHF